MIVESKHKFKGIDEGVSRMCEIIENIRLKAARRDARKVAMKL